MRLFLLWLKMYMIKFPIVPKKEFEWFTLFYRFWNNCHFFWINRSKISMHLLDFMKTSLLSSQILFLSLTLKIFHFKIQMSKNSVNNTSRSQVNYHLGLSRNDRCGPSITEWERVEEFSIWWLTGSQCTKVFCLIKQLQVLLTIKIHIFEYD